jgi:hypothetical protein
MRVFHAMPKQAYFISDSAQTRSLTGALKFGTHSPELASFADWGIADWSTFFDIHGMRGVRNVTRIRPAAVANLIASDGGPVSNEDDPITLADIKTADAMGLRQGTEAGEHLLAPAIAELSPANRAATVRTFLDQAMAQTEGLQPSARRPSAEDLTKFSQHAPLVFLLQLESHLASGGRRLGPAGGRFFASVIGAYANVAEDSLHQIPTMPAAARGMVKDKFSDVLNAI